MEGALVDRAVAEEAQHDLVGVAQADRVAHARRHRQVAADDAVAAEVAGGHVVEVHRAALAAADPADLAAQLGHQRPRVGAAGEGVAVVAVGGDEVVVGAQQAHRPHRHRLLADVQVEEAADLPLHVDLGATLLEAPDEEHGPVLRERLVFRHSVPGFLCAAIGRNPISTLDYGRRQRRGHALPSGLARRPSRGRGGLPATGRRPFAVGGGGLSPRGWTAHRPWPRTRYAIAETASPSPTIARIERAKVGSEAPAPLPPRRLPNASFTSGRVA